MSNLLEITGEEITFLGDTDLRTLIGLLSESDYRLAGLSPKGIEWGGHQNAPDGGMDVAVESMEMPPNNSFIPRRCTVFQVKKPNMGPAEILAEMKPNGVLRDFIKDLINKDGSYVIISSGSNCAKQTKIKTRIKAMRDAVEDADPQGRLFLDFYDRGRIATWVRLHPSLILWVKNKIGRSLKGWYPYDNWSHAHKSVKDTYFIDEKLKVREQFTTNSKISVEQAIIRIRSLLSVPKNSIRLVGLSGVGKTRFARALFDDSVFEHPLNPMLAYYTDTSYEPNPDPRSLAEQLSAQNARGILVVDNCSADLHRRLAEVCAKENSNISVLTIEYDIRDDKPVDTSVFILESSSNSLVEKLIIKQFPEIGQINARTIARLSEGNARVAIALSDGAKSGEDLSSLNDSQLFDRLLFQRNEQDRDLKISAEACSLVYSFNGINVTSEDSEIKLLSNLINKTPRQLFRDISILQDRGLIQKRGIYSALLPHAIANKLAVDALRSIPREDIIKTFLSSGSNEFIKSFCKRLSYLHECEIAVQIVNDWLANDGWIGESCGDFSKFGMDIFKLVAPVSPEKALMAIEHQALISNGKEFFSRRNQHHLDFVEMLCRLSYDESLFCRSVNLLNNFAFSEDPNETHDATRYKLKHLFSLQLSGTHASAETRCNVITNLLDTNKYNEQQLGLFLLDSALETISFEGDVDMSFGARNRDYGYQPKTSQDVTSWYQIFMKCCLRYILSNSAVSEQAKKILSGKLRGLWTKAKMFNEIEDMSRQIQNGAQWSDGWIAVCKTIGYDGLKMNVDILDRLRTLAQLLKPKNLVDKVRTYLLSSSYFDQSVEHVIVNEDLVCSNFVTKTENLIYDLGINVAKNEDTLDLMLPELCSSKSIYLNVFSQGLTDGYLHKTKLWEKLKYQFTITSIEISNINILLGFLSACSRSTPDFYNLTLDGIIHDASLNEYYPILQTASKLDEKAIKRLISALDTCDITISNFKYIAYGGYINSVNDDDLAIILQKIYNKKDGSNVAVEILSQCINAKGKEQHKYSESLLKVARDILVTFKFTSENRLSSMTIFAVGEVSTVCLKGVCAQDTTKTLCDNIIHGIRKNRRHTGDYIDLLNKIAFMQPVVFLDKFFAHNALETHQNANIFSTAIESPSNPLNQISDHEIVTWCDLDPELRYPRITSSIQPFTKQEGSAPPQWKPIVYAILEKAPNLNVIFEYLYDSIIPRSYFGAKSDIMQARYPLMECLFEHEIEEVRVIARQKYKFLLDEVKVAKEREIVTDKPTDDSFE